MHSYSKKRSSSFLVALLFTAGDVRRYCLQTDMEENIINSTRKDDKRDVIIFAWILPILFVFLLFLAAWRIDIKTSKDSFAGFGYFVLLAPFMTVIGISNFWVLGLRGKNKSKSSLFLTGLILPLLLFILLHIF